VVTAHDCFGEWLMDNALASKAYLITETRVDSKTSIQSLMNVFRAQRQTVHVTVQVNQGSVCEILVTEKKKVTENSVDNEL
jgi:hypothetical protein